MSIGRIWIFDEGKLEEALQRYEQASLEAYPDQRARILITIEAMRDFFHSEHANKLLWGGSDGKAENPSR